GAGVVYHGMEILGGGAILAGMILGAVAAFIIDRDFDRAAMYGLAGAVLSFFGFIHGERLGVGIVREAGAIAVTSSGKVALGYLLPAAFCGPTARRAPAESKARSAGTAAGRH